MLILKRLPAKFYGQNTLKLAQKLLGKYIIRIDKNHKLIGKIVETEAYYGPSDLASHAAKGKTPRTKIMFDQAGLAYIYLIYGMYYCFNIVTERPDFPAAILIRAVEPIAGIPEMLKNRKCHPEHSRRVTRPSHGSTEPALSQTEGLTMTKTLTNGPAKFCQAFKIERKLNGLDLKNSRILYLAENPQEKIKPARISQVKRIGIDYAGPYKHKPWRFYLKDNLFISRE